MKKMKFSKKPTGIEEVSEPVHLSALDETEQVTAVPETAIASADEHSPSYHGVGGRFIELGGGKRAPAP